MRLTVLGCGDAFGSGGRLQTSYHIDVGGRCMLVDCGATALIGMQRANLDPNRVDLIQISHLHGDHFSGLVWWHLHAVHVARRSTPLTIAGPVGIEARFRQAAEILFPGSLAGKAPFEYRFVEQRAGSGYDVAGFEVTAFEVSHPSGAASHALRIAAGGKAIAFSGDTEWVDTLVPCAAGADLFLCECYAYDQPVRYHLSWLKLQQELPRLHARRIVLTHMNAQMLASAQRVLGHGVMLAEDGLVIDL